jgi:hypothetical protein
MLIIVVLLFVGNLALLSAVLWTGRMSWATPALGLLTAILIVLRARFPEWTDRNKAPLAVVALSLAVALVVVFARGIGTARASRPAACPPRAIPSGTAPLPETLAT